MNTACLLFKACAPQLKERIGDLVPAHTCVVSDIVELTVYDLIIIEWVIKALTYLETGNFSLSYVIQCNKYSYLIYFSSIGCHNNYEVVKSHKPFSK